jgi:hypothetical protein
MDASYKVIWWSHRTIRRSITVAYASLWQKDPTDLEKQECSKIHPAMTTQTFLDRLIYSFEDVLDR